MSESKHTPGPWRAAAKPSSIVGWPVTSETGRVVCDVNWQFRASFEKDVSGVEFNRTSEANARLIAAAPCVVEGGSFLLDRLDDFERVMEANEDTEREWHGHVAPAIARFRAAIAKATGGDQ